jgi:hypothetical protein
LRKSLKQNNGWFSKWYWKLHEKYVWEIVELQFLFWFLKSSISSHLIYQLLDNCLEMLEETLLFQLIHIFSKIKILVSGPHYLGISFVHSVKS